MTRTEARSRDRADAPLDRTIDWYDSHAETYAAQFADVDLAHDRRAFVANLPPVTRPVLDAGTGSGRDCALLGCEGVRPIGVDLSAGLLREAGLRARCPLLRADVRRLPFRSNSISGVWSVAVLLHLPIREATAALREFHRVLVDGGALFLSVREGVGTDWREASPGGRWFQLYSTEEISSMARSVGFKIRRLSAEPGVVGRTWVNLHAVRG